MLVAAFVLLRCAAPPVTKRRARHCLAVRSRRRTSVLLAAHSPTTAFQTPRQPSEAPDTNPAATVVPRLLMIFIATVTSLEGRTLRQKVDGRSSRFHAPFAPALAGDFRGQNVQAPPYPSPRALRCSAPSPVATYRQALFGPFMVELFTFAFWGSSAAFVARYPDVVDSTRPSTLRS